LLCLGPLARLFSSFLSNFPYLYTLVHFTIKHDVLHHFWCSAFCAIPSFAEVGHSQPVLPHLGALWMSFHRKFLTFVERSLLFVSRAFQMHLSIGWQFSRSLIVSHLRFRFDRVAPCLGFLGFWHFIISLYVKFAWALAWLCSGDVINRVFCMFLRDEPSAASWLACSFPSILEWPLIHSKVVAPAHFLILLMVGLSILAWLMLAKFSSMSCAVFT